MNKIIKILVILLISIVCILASSGVSWGAEDYPTLPTLQELINGLGNDVTEKINHPDDTGKVNLNGSTGVKYSGTTYNVKKSNFTSSPNKTYTYCVSRGVGNGYLDENGKWHMGKTGQYTLKLFIMINKKGIFFNHAEGSNPGQHEESAVYRISWEDALEASKPGSEDLYGSAKKMYYILSAEDKYGTNDNGFKYETNENAYIDDDYRLETWNVNESYSYITTARQHAIWWTINPLLDYFKVWYKGRFLCNEEAYFDKNTGKYWDPENPFLIEVKNKYIEDSINIGEEPVYMWILSSKNQEGFNQDILVGGKSNTPPSTPDTVSLTVNKEDNDGHSLEGATIRLYDANTKQWWSENGVQEWKMNSSTKTFEGLTKGHSYIVIEVEPPQDKKINGVEYTYSNQTVYPLKFDTGELIWNHVITWKQLTLNQATNSVTLINTGQSKYTSLTVYKKDNLGNTLEGAKIRLYNASKKVWWSENGTQEWRMTSGTKTFNGLTVGESYIVVEVEAPYDKTINGVKYTYSNQTVYPLKFDTGELIWNHVIRWEQLTLMQSANSVTLINTGEVLGSITLTKVDKNGNLINGIYFDLLNVDGINLTTHEEFEQFFTKLSQEAYNKRKIATQYTGQSAGKGKVKFENLKLGKYILRETNVKDDSLESYKRNIGSIVNDRWRIYN